MSSFVVVSLPFLPLLIILKMFARQKLVFLVSVLSKSLVKTLNIKIQYKIPDEYEANKNYLIVSNHLSYLDVIILAAKFPGCFVTSKEIQRTPVLGQLTSLAGCVFVDRKNKSKIKDEIIELRSALDYGLNVVVFPEATSTNGEDVLRFRRPLFEASIATQKPILPITINYLKIDNREISRLNRDIVCWYGDMGFLSHFLKVLEQKTIFVEVILSAPFLPELLPSLDLALKSHQMVKSKYICFSNPAMEAL